MQLSYFPLLLLHQFLETVLEFLFKSFAILCGLGLPVFLFLLEVVNLFLEDLDVEFELLFDLYMVSHFGLVVLQLRLVLFRWQVQ